MFNVHMPLIVMSIFLRRFIPGGYDDIILPSIDLPPVAIHQRSPRHTRASHPQRHRQLATLDVIRANPGDPPPSLQWLEMAPLSNEIYVCKGQGP